MIRCMSSVIFLPFRIIALIAYWRLAITLFLRHVCLATNSASASSIIVTPPLLSLISILFVSEVIASQSPPHGMGSTL